MFGIIGKDLRRAGLKSGKAVAGKDADVGSDDVGVVSLTGKVCAAATNHTHAYM